MRIAPIVLLALSIGSGTNACLRSSLAQSGSKPNQRIWSEFASLMKDGKIAESHVKPAYTTKSTMLQFLEKMRQGASWPEWERQPEVYRVGSLIHFVIRLSEHGIPDTYTFTFLEEGGQWFLQHFESIVVRLDRVGTPPVSTFPDLPEDKKTWI